MNQNSTRQSYQIALISLIAFCITTALLFFLAYSIHYFYNFFMLLTLVFIVLDLSTFFILILLLFQREEVSTLFIPKMTKKANNLAIQLRRLFNDKQITDVLKLSNSTRFGEEMPEIHIYIFENCDEGYVAIENISNYERADKEKFEQRISGIFCGKYQRFAVVRSELTVDDSYILFYFEDTLTSQRLIIKHEDDLQHLVHENNHAIRLSKNLVWYSDVTPMLSIIARTRAGKSILAGRYIAKLMKLQGWIVEYNSAKYDRYVKEFYGQSDAIKIVERAEFWCSVMNERLSEINNANKEKYLEMDNMPDVAVFFDEIGNLNASLESLDKVDKTLKITSRWINAINKLSSTGGSTGIHIIAISQFATKEAFLPSLARVNCSDAVIMLGGAADSASERQYLIAGFADMPKRSFKKGQGVARILGAGKKWETPHFFESPWLEYIE